MRLRHSSFRSFRIDQQLMADQEGRNKDIQLLFLGGQNSGKNTMIKQLRIHFGDGFPTKVRKNFVQVLLANLADAVCFVLEEMRNNDKEFSDPYAKAEIAKELLVSQPDEGFVYQVKMDDFASSELELESSLKAAAESISFGNTDDQPHLKHSSDPHIVYFEGGSQVGSHVVENSNLLTDLQLRLSTANPLAANFRNRYAEFARASLLGSDDVEDHLRLANWLEYSLSYCPFSERHAQKVMSILAERTRNPQIFTLPSELAAQLPPPTQLPPTPPSLSLLDQDSTTLTTSDKWSSTTTFELRNQRFGSQSEGGSIHSTQKETYRLSIPNEYTPPRGQSDKHSSKNSGLRHDGEQATTSGAVHPMIADENRTEISTRLAKDGVPMNALSTLWWLTKNLKVLTDQPEFRETISSETFFPISIASSRL
ncbi:unnamed protein product [Schistocephalus solidus]|uniref:G-protein alpha subunit n=1 Tax=Schistocephalus solidus TaxID=70667 RepID=A0A183SGE7_SCHSO|nr:unnamed protein product [Schistocephalus solidus]